MVDEKAPAINDIDEIVGGWSERHQEEADRIATAASERERFIQDFKRITDSIIRPTMQSAAERLEKDGGGGLVVEHPEVGSHGPWVILWMSLEESISGEPREDHNPYLRIDADIPHRSIAVWEGDMWENRGTSGPSAPWALSDVTAERVTTRILGILQRAASHGSAP